MWGLKFIFVLYFDAVQYEVKIWNRSLISDKCMKVCVFDLVKTTVYGIIFFTVFHSYYKSVMRG